MEIHNRYLNLPLVRQDVEYIFDRSLPELPEPININGIYQYPVFVDLTLYNAIEKYVFHLSKMASDPKYIMKIDIFPAGKYATHTAIDYELNYETKLKQLLFTIMEHDSNGIYLNLFFVVLSILFSEKVKTVFQDSKNQFALNPIVHTFHKRILDETFEMFKRKHPYRYKVNYDDFKPTLINFILRDQLAMFTGKTQLLPEHFLSDKQAKFFNARFLLSLDGFKRIRDIMLEGARYIHKTERYASLIKRKHLHMPEDGNYERFVYGVRETVFLLQNEYIMSLIGKDRILKDEIDTLGISLHEMVLLYEDIIFSLKRKLVLTALQSNIYLHSVTTDVQVLHKRFEEGVVFRFEENRDVHKLVKEASVFFMDIRNFSLKSRNLSPDELTSQLHTILDPLPDIITDFGGNVDKMLGDGLMALFGTDEENEDHAMNSVRTAVCVHETFENLKDKVVFENIGVGINTGKISIAQFGQVTAIGQTVNAAARLCSSTSKDTEQTPEDIAFEIVHGPSYVIDEKVYIQKIQNHSSEYRVDVLDKGELYNIGIAISSQTLSAIKKRYGLYETYEEQSRFYYMNDPQTQREFVFRFAGKAVLKGVGDEMVYDVIWDPKTIAEFKAKSSSIEQNTDEFFKRLMKKDG